MLFTEVANDIHAHMLLLAVSDPTGAAVTSLDLKRSSGYINSMLRAAVASIADVLRRAGDQSTLWSLCRISKGLVTVAGRYEMGTGNADGVEQADGAGLVDGAIVAVEVTFDTADALPNPFDADTVWYYAEPDSATAIARRRALTSRLLAPLKSYEVVGPRIYTAGTGIRITYIPGNFGTGVADTIPNAIVFPVMAEALSMLYGQNAAESEIGAAGFYTQKASEYKQLILTGTQQFQPLPPYQGN